MAFARQVGEVRASLSRVAYCAGCQQLSCLQVEHVVCHGQGATLGKAPPQLQRQPPQGWPGGANVKERFFPGRRKTLRPAEDLQEKPSSQRVQGASTLS